MRTVYTDLNIKTQIESTLFYALNIVFEQFSRSLPKHSHGNNSYEIHYIPFGHGNVLINNRPYNITPNTLYITGPHVEHEQIPLKKDPMSEYCIYFKLQELSSHTSFTTDSVVSKFKANPFWYGQDTQDLYPLMQQIFLELDHQYTGYMIQVESLLQQCIIKLVRNYEYKQQSKLQFPPSNLVESKYLIVEESFLYDYQSITLERLSKKLGLSTRQTERFLKDYYGKTFLEKKTDAKMSMATIYLSDPDLSISEIANRLNYSSIQHFSYAFKQYYGISATTYRRYHTHS